MSNTPSRGDTRDVRTPHGGSRRAGGGASTPGRHPDICTDGAYSLSTMAIPTWLCAEDGPRDERDADPAAVDPSDLGAATDVFEVLADPTRLAVLATLHERSTPMSYTALREATSVEDKGRFNYHLRRLDGLVRSVDGEYYLTRRGAELVERALADEFAR
ncbi:hypothetical protein JCM17092_04270 [Haloplanus litoreus]